MTAAEPPVAEAIRAVMAAATPADLFDPAAPVRHYRRLVKALHPDRVAAAGHDGALAAAAADAFARLIALWQAREPVLRTAAGEYRLRRPRYAGDLSDLYDAGADRLVKIPRDPTNNDLMEREARALRRLADRGDPRLLPYVPRLVDSLHHVDPATGALRRVNVVATVPRLRSLAELRRAFPHGLDARDVAWMWRRLLVAVGFAHRAGVVHGAVLPDHVLIEPDEHGVVLVDWCYATFGGEAVPALVPTYADWYPQEVHRRREAGPETDIFMATRCMTCLLNADAPAALRSFAAGCTLPGRRQRPDDAWRLLGELDEVLARLYGPRRFRPLRWPRQEDQ